MSLKYFWIVEYRDGTIIKQFNKNEEILWKEIDESQIKTVSWAKKTLFGTKIKASINIKPHEKIAICRRNHIGIGVKSGETERLTEYLLGKNGEYTIKLE
jgi:hypothetical protein